MLQSQQYNSIEITIYHEAGHAVMARLFGRCVYKIVLELNTAGTYNGRVDWGREELSMRAWDPNIPYARLQLRQEDGDHVVPLVFAAGKAAERVWLRQRGLDETLASFGSDSDAWNDKQEIENELRNITWLKPERILQEMQAIEELAVKLLASCWQVIEVVAQALLNGIQNTPKYFSLDDVQQRMATAFASM